VGVYIQSIDCESATITLESGERIQGDAVIGCDGIKSVVRSAVLGEAGSRPRNLYHPVQYSSLTGEGTSYRAEPSGHCAYRFLLHSDQITSDPEIAHFITDSGLSVTRTESGRLVFYPCRNLTLLNGVAIMPDIIGDATESWSQDGDPDEMRSYFTEYPEKYQKLLRLVDKCRLWQLRDQDPLPWWTRGKAIILGDAAHPMLPRMPIYFP
jgi:salicylate hydroxylase